MISTTTLRRAAFRGLLGASAGLAARIRTIFWPQTPIDGPLGALTAGSAAEVRAHLGLD